MNSSLSFFSFEPLREVPEVCSQCSASSPALIYESRTYRDGEDPEEARGFCCVRCAVELLKKLERSEAQQWTQEEAALRAENVDVSDFHSHRLAAFRRMGGL
jgi:hypothetical protein